MEISKPTKRNATKREVPTLPADSMKQEANGSVTITKVEIQAKSSRRRGLKWEQ